MYKIKFPLLDNYSDCIVVGTTRPETLFGDIAIALHPDDERVKRKKVFHPILKKAIPIVSDDKLVVLGIGTGAVKITPGHDKDDYDCALRHFGQNHSNFVDLFDDCGIIRNEVLDNTSFGEFSGFDRWKLRSSVIDYLKMADLLVEEAGVTQHIPICSKTSDVIERRLLPQWYVR